MEEMYVQTHNSYFSYPAIFIFMTDEKYSNTSGLDWIMLPNSNNNSDNNSYLQACNTVKIYNSFFSLRVLQAEHYMPIQPDI